MANNVEVVDGVAYQYGADWTRKLEQKKHWELYWCQQKLMDGLVAPGEDRVLEIGVGSGFAANYMRSRGVSVTTLDIDPDKRPDIVGNVVTYDFPDRFDAVMAFEILEHIPYREFEKIMARLPGVAEKHVFLSLPRNVVSLARFGLKLPRLREFEVDLKVRRRRIGTPNHHWEMDHGSHSIASVEAVFAKNGFSIARKFNERNIHFYALACPCTSAPNEQPDGPVQHGTAEGSADK